MKFELFAGIEPNDRVPKLVAIRIKLYGFYCGRINLFRDLRISVNADKKYQEKKIPHTPHTAPIIA
jgi:hypothetical protein